MDKGYTPEYAESLLAEAQRVFPVVRAQEKQQQAAEKRALRRSERGNWLATIIGGVAVVTVGLVVSYIGYVLIGTHGAQLIAIGAF